MIFGPIPDVELLHRYGIVSDSFRVTNMLIRHESPKSWGGRSLLYVRRFASNSERSLYKIYEPDWRDREDCLIIGEVGVCLTLEEIENLPYTV